MRITSGEKIGTLSELLTRIRLAVRGQNAYIVGGAGSEGIRIKLNQNESPFDLPEDLKESVIIQLRALQWNRYPGEQPEEFRSVLAEYLEYDRRGIIVGNGSNEISYTLGLALIERGTAVVLPRPMFSLYEKIVRLHDGIPIGIPPRDDLSFDAEAVESAVREHDPALTILATPNNPTGRAMKPAEIERIAAAARGFVLVDEAYLEFSGFPSAVDLIESFPNVMVLRTFSKAMGLAGLRLGYLLGSPAVVDELYKPRIPFMVDPLTEAAGVVLIRNMDRVKARVAQILRERDNLFETLSSLEGVDPVPSQANFIIFRTGVEPRELITRLAARGVLIRDVSGYPELSGFVRVTAGLPDENKAFLSALNQTLNPQ